MLLSQRRSQTIVLVLILTVVFFAFWPTLQSDFVNWDDPVHLLENTSVQSLDGASLKAMFTGTVNKIYIPLTSLSFALEYHFFGYNPFIYHLDNLLLHLLVTALVFVFAMRLGLSMMAAGLASLLFGLHPMHVESVAWITERKDVLYASFYMAALNVHWEYTKASGGKRKFYYGLTLGLGILSILAKPMAVSLPLILLLCDWFQGRKMTRDVFLEKIPHFFVLGAVTVVTYLAHARVPQEIITQGWFIWIWTFVFYIKQFIAPFLLAPIYHLPSPVAFLNPEFFIPVVIFMLLLVAVWRFRHYRWFIFGFFFYVFSIFFLLRFDDVVDTNIVADRFMYLPSVGFCLLFGYGVFYWSKKIKPPVLKGALAVCCLVLFSLFAFKTFQQCRIWENSIALWNYELLLHPNEPAALNNLATAYREQAPFKKAERQYLQIKQWADRQKDATDVYPASVSNRITYVSSLYKKALAIRPAYTDGYFNLGNLYLDIGEFAKAIEHYTQAIQHDSDHRESYLKLGEAYTRSGDVNSAVVTYEKLLSLAPKDEILYANVASAYGTLRRMNKDDDALREAHKKIIQRFAAHIKSQPGRAASYLNLGILYHETGDYEQATLAYRRALNIDPRYTKALYNYGNLLKDVGRLNEAMAQYRKVIQFDPRYSDAYLNLGIIYTALGKGEEAQRLYEQAIKTDPGNANAYFNLAYEYERAQKFSKAVELYQKVIQADPVHAEAHYNLGNIYVRLSKNQEAIAQYKATVDLDPEHLDAFVNLSLIYYQMGDYPSAIEYVDEARVLGYVPPEQYSKALEPYRQIFDK